MYEYYVYTYLMRKDLKSVKIIVKLIVTSYH